MDRAELIAALEKATGPSRELDAEIAALIGWLCVGTRAGYREIVGTPPPPMQKGRGIKTIPAYTASIDAIKAEAPGTWQWHCGTCNEDDLPWATLTDTDTWVDYSAEANTPELAFCAAVIRAREAT